MTRATGYSRLLEAQGVALVYKQRDVQVNNKSSALAMIGDVEGKDVLIVDDMIDTVARSCTLPELFANVVPNYTSSSDAWYLFRGCTTEKLQTRQLMKYLPQTRLLIERSHRQSQNYGYFTGATVG